MRYINAQYLLTAPGLLQCNVRWHSITPCMALAINDERGHTARFHVIKVWSHDAAPTPITLAETSMVDRLQAGRPGLQILHGHTSLTNFIIQQSRSFEGVCILIRLTNWLFPVPDPQPTATELFQSPLYGSAAVFYSISYLLLHFPSSALTWRHTSSNSVARNYRCHAHIYTVIYVHVNRSFLLTYLRVICSKVRIKFNRTQISKSHLYNNFCILFALTQSGLFACQNTGQHVWLWEMC